jgi:uncharacterized membrane protein YcaP (DUF421 family)
MEEKNINAFDFRRILLPQEMEWSFLGEVAFRTFVMFLLLMLFFKLTGKRSIYQLSLFEIALIVGLGSAAGDPMFYHDVGLLPAFIVFIIVGLLYKGITHLTMTSEKAEKIIEGKPMPLLLNDLMMVSNLDSEAISYDEFFAFLRVSHVEHLGQVRVAYLETTGNISIFLYPDDKVKPGLPILPEKLNYYFTEIKSEGLHSCLRCGHTAHFDAGIKPVCSNCHGVKWLRSIASLRLS